MMKVNISKSIPTKAPCPQANQLIAIQKSARATFMPAQLNLNVFNISKSFLADVYSKTVHMKRVTSLPTMIHL